jgi:hypothetical protein
MGKPPIPKSEVGNGMRRVPDPFFDALALRSGSAVGNNKSIRDGSKVFFLGDQFSLAFAEKKSIWRTKKSAQEHPGVRSRRDGQQRENGAEEKNARKTLLFLTKSSIFDK